MEQIKILSPIKIVGNAKNQTVASVEQQPDLLYMRSVLASTGSNLNDDVFLPEEMWKARSSPKLKPVNWEHNSGRELTEEEIQSAPDKVVIDNQIIGVMHNSYATDENGVIISEEKVSAADFSIPDNFHIEDEAIIWKSLYPKAAARVEKGAADGTLFVSMEAWFTDYNYLVGDKVVARNEQTAFLDKNLKANGGTGSFGNTSVKRVLKNIVFGGKGIVERPANEPSVIKSVTHEPITASVLVNKAIANNIIGEIGFSSTTKVEESDKMAEIKNEAQVAAVPLDQYTKLTDEAACLRVEVKSTNAQLDESKTKNGELSEQLDSIQNAFSKGSKALEKVLPGISDKLEGADVSEFFNVLSQAIESKNTEVTEASKKLTEASDKLADAEATLRATKRLSKIKAELNLVAVEGDDEDIVKAKVSQAEKIADETKTLDDEAFASRLSDLKSLLTLAAKHPEFENKKDKDKDKKDKKDAKASDGITDESILDNIIVSETMTPGTESNESPQFNMQKAYSGLANLILSSNKRQKPSNGNN